MLSLFHCTMFIPTIQVTSDESVEKEFTRLIKMVNNNKTILDQAIKYDQFCRDKYHSIMSTALTSVGCSLTENGIKYVVQSSYSAEVYIDTPGDVDLDIVALYNDDNELIRLRYVTCEMGFEYLETRNADMPHMIHYVYTKKYGMFEIELKLRFWDTYKDHLYKIHNYLDALPAATRIAWRYIRKTVMNKDDKTKKMIKYLWYMYGAIKTGVPTNKEYFPMNIYY